MKAVEPIRDINKLKKNNRSIAIITKTDTEAATIYKLLKRNFEELTLIANNSKAFSRELVVIPSYMAKGLEYDATIVYTDISSPFTYKERYLYYVACTRSQHHLVIYNQKEA